MSTGAIINMKAIITMLLLAGFVMMPAQSADGQDARQEIRQMLDERDNEIKGILGSRDTFTDAQREELKLLINEVIDFESMGRTALGPHWSSISAAQQQDFVEVFGDVVRAQSLSNLDIYRSAVRYDAIDVTGSDATVVTTAIHDDTEMKVAYDLVKKGDDWRVTDIILDGTSTAQGYANSFQRVFARHGFDRLMQSLRSRAAR